MLLRVYRAQGDSGRSKKDDDAHPDDRPIVQGEDLGDEDTVFDVEGADGPSTSGKKATSLGADAMRLVRGSLSSRQLTVNP